MPGNRRRGVTPERQALNRHLHRHHGGATARGTLTEKFTAHDDLHWQARRQGVDLGHTHEPWQEGESDLQMAQRFLADGDAQDGQE